jgi:xylulokinase
MSQAALVVGIDIGTGGVRVVACDGHGQTWAEAGRPLATAGDGPVVEQDPAEWWQGTAACLRQVTAEVRGRAMIVAVGVAATSGTVCLLDERGHALRPAIMYADRRGQEEVTRINQVAEDLDQRLGYRFNTSWGLPKLLWLLQHEPDRAARAGCFAHAGDVITGRLCGDYRVTDLTQALKTGYDLLEGRWPSWIETQLGLPLAKFPRVVPSGQIVGRVTATAAEETGLSTQTIVVAGMTDGCASQIAAGATQPGQWLSVLGTTLVVKGVSEELVRDPLGRIYCHRHPEGYWLPGAASNTGGAALSAWPAGALASLDREAMHLTPASVVVYPLRQQGERFPFVQPAAQGFVEGTPGSAGELYAATLEGVAYVERLGYEIVRELGVAIHPPLLTAGGGAKSSVWTQIRADVLQQPVGVAAMTGAGFGAAVLAASATLHDTLAAACRAMTRITEIVMPRGERAARYDENYRRFLATCQARGYLAEAGGGIERISPGADTSAGQPPAAPAFGTHSAHR